MYKVWFKENCLVDIGIKLSKKKTFEKNIYFIYILHIPLHKIKIYKFKFINFDKFI